MSNHPAIDALFAGEGYPCRFCEKPFRSGLARAGHMGKCKVRREQLAAEPPEDDPEPPARARRPAPAAAPVDLDPADSDWTPEGLRRQRRAEAIFPRWKPPPPKPQIPSFHTPSYLREPK